MRNVRDSSRYEEPNPAVFEKSFTQEKHISTDEAYELLKDLYAIKVLDYVEKSVNRSVLHNLEKVFDVLKTSV